VNPLSSARAALVANDYERAIAIAAPYCRDQANSLADFAQISDLARSIEVKLGGSDGAVPVARVAIVSDYTTDSLAMAVRCALMGDGVVASVYEATIGTVSQEILDPASGLNAFHPDTILVATGRHGLTSEPDRASSQEDIDRILSGELDKWQKLWLIAREGNSCSIIQHLYDISSEQYVGLAERLLPWSSSRFIAALNQRLIESAPGFLRWLDIDDLAAAVGRQNWFDSRLYYSSKFPMAMRFVPQYARSFRGAWRSLTGRTKKALVVDLDNTLWGGVIGDDGLEGIRLGVGSPEGEAFAAFGRFLLALQRRGVILAVCSKNAPEIAQEVFRRHPQMPLKLESFAAFVCNWGDKAANIRSIAAELNIDVSSLVFADDNPAECERIRQEIPELSVIHLAGDPAEYPRLIDDQHLFDAAAISQEDLARTASYVARREMLGLRQDAADLGQFLASLQMKGTAALATRQDVARLAQLELKTNQFNLTTRRYSPEAIEEFISSPDCLVLTLRLADRFADHGLVGSLIARMEEGRLRVESWLLSCRVFSRTAEEFIMGELIDHARAWGLREIIGEYLPTPKNGVVAELYARMGFSQVGTDNRWWQLPLRDVNKPRSYIEKQSSAEAAVSTPG
jgi:FkbH-like protein